MGTANDRAVLQSIFNPSTPFGDIPGLDEEEDVPEEGEVRLERAAGGGREGGSAGWKQPPPEAGSGHPLPSRPRAPLAPPQETPLCRSCWSRSGTWSCRGSPPPSPAM